jgi:hypothetical protein
LKRIKVKKQGLAIITTMLILTLLLGLIAAFLVVNRAGNRFTVSSVERRTAQDICMTAFSYAWFQLEKERSWGDGTTPFNSTERYPIASPQVQMDHSQEDGVPVIAVQGLYSQRGNFDEPQGTFTMTIENNLQGRSPSASGSTVNVPARSVRIEVVANVGGVTKKLTTLLRPNPISHDGMSGGGNLNLDEAGLLRIESRDPYVNRIRGNNLNLPFEDDIQFLKHGIGASSDELTVGGTNLATASDSVVRAAGEASGGVYKPNAPVQEIQEFDPNEITLPNNSSNIPEGTWTFGDVTAIEYNEHTLNYEVHHGGGGPDDPPPPPSVEQTTRYQRKTSIYNQLTAPDGQVYTAAQAVEGSEELDPPFDPAPMYGSEGAANDYGYGNTDDATAFTGNDVHTLAPGFKANVTTAQMVVHPEIALRVSGDFIVESTGDRLPELYFGYDLTDGGVATQLSLVDGLEAAQDDPGKYMAGIVADGDVNVTGGVLGYGSMIAGGDLTIKASSGLRVAPDLGVVVKGNRVIINPATEPEPGFPGEPVPFDYNVYRDAIQDQSDGDWTLYNAWLEHDQPTRDSVIASLGSTSTGSDPTVLWNTLCDEIGETFPAPDFSAYGWQGPATVDQYMRLKEFLQTRASGYNDGDGDPSWLQLNQRQEDSAGRVAGVLNGIAQWSKSFKQTFQAYLTTPDQGPPDMFLEGLVYADEDIIIDATDKSIRLEGAVVARRDITINAPSQVDIVYNRGLLDDLTAASGVGPVRLEKVFFTLE